MMRFALVTLLTLVSSWGASTPASILPGAVPPPASIVQAAALPGSPHRRIIVYRSGSEAYLAVTSSANRVVWQQRIVGRLYRLLVPGPAGVFAVVTHRPHGASVYAFRATAHGIRSALVGRPDGRIYGDEGVIMLRRGFQIRERDWKHRGSIEYRYVTKYDLAGGQYVLRSYHLTPNYPPNQYPTPNAVFQASNGNTILLRLEVASTEAQRERGLMDRPSLDPDSGMVFTWPSPVQDSFWMENTLIPLAVAFVGADDRVQETQDMQAETCTLHTPSEPYQYAIEANLGYFAANRIAQGARVTFHLAGKPSPTPAPMPAATITPTAPCTTVATALGIK